MPKDSKKEKKHSKTREDKESKQIEEKGASKEAEDEKKKAKDEKKKKDVAERMNRATMKLHGVDNAQTFEHPASFQMETGQLNP